MTFRLSLAEEDVCSLGAIRTGSAGGHDPDPEKYGPCRRCGLGDGVDWSVSCPQDGQGNYLPCRPGGGLVERGRFIGEEKRIAEAVAFVRDLGSVCMHGPLPQETVYNLWSAAATLASAASREPAAVQYWKLVADLVTELDHKHRGAGPRMGDDDILGLVCQTLRRAAESAKDKA